MQSSSGLALLGCQAAGPGACAVQANGETARDIDGWQGQRRTCAASSSDRSAMLLICAAGRHSDEHERPCYSVRVGHPEAAPQGAPWAAQWRSPSFFWRDDKLAGSRLRLHPPAQEPWACSACTYRHEGAQAAFLACAVCGHKKHA